MNAQPAEESAASDTRRPQVVVIDDNDVNILLLQRILSFRPKVEVLFASDGKQGLDLIRSTRPALVLLDLNLPSMSGEEILLAVRSEKDTADVPIVVLSGDATATADRRAREAGAQDFLRKPFGVNALLEAVDRHLAG